ncbi:hypothetical protein KBC70_02505 [Candidatus Woesebacteria bacterium]|nr:hypothetical protein [Candidatus Woesebacteria bacterium]
MKNSPLTMKFTVFGLVFVLSVIFFWLAINQYLLPSSAQLDSNLQIVPHATNIECHPKGECYVHILGSTETQNGVAGVTGQVKYGDFLEPVRVDMKGVCAQSSLGLTEPLQFNDDKATKIVTFSVGSLKADSELKGGNGCLTTLVFKPVGVTADPQETGIGFVGPANWKAGGMVQGVRAPFQVKLDEANVRIKITSTAILPPIEDVSPTPEPSQPPSCNLDKGDCNCDGEIDTIDYEMIRSYTHNEGKMCDVVKDGVGDIKDVAKWIENNSLVKNNIPVKK